VPACLERPGSHLGHVHVSSRKERELDNLLESAESRWAVIWAWWRIYSILLIFIMLRVLSAMRHAPCANPRTLVTALRLTPLSPGKG
jgi:hypothetical protein